MEMLQVAQMDQVLDFWNLMASHLSDCADLQAYDVSFNHASSDRTSSQDHGIKSQAIKPTSIQPTRKCPRWIVLCISTWDEVSIPASSLSVRQVYTKSSRQECQYTVEHSPIPMELASPILVSSDKYR